MSSPRSAPTAGPASRGLPRGEVIGRYGTYADAQKAVDHLADEQFEVAKVAIVGNDLKSVEQVTGRLSYPRVAGQGALNGMVFGAFLGMILSLLGGEQWLPTLAVSVLMGGAFWMLLATVTYAMQRGRRDFTSTNQIVATSYDVVAAPEVAHRARQVLQGLRGLSGLPVPGAPAGPPQDRARPGQPGAPWQQGTQAAPPPGPRTQGSPHPAPRYGEAGAPGAPGGGTGEAWPRPAYGAGPAGGTPPHGQAPGGASPGGTPSGGAAPVAPPERSALFEDLPDGRPQYGIRLPQHGAPRPHDGAGGQGTGEFRGDGARDASAAEEPSGEDGPPAGGSSAAGPPR